MDCQCAEAGHCPVFNRRMTGRLYDICRGHDDAGNGVLTSEKRERYKLMWQQQSGLNILENQCIYSQREKELIVVDGLGKVVKGVLDKVGVSNLLRWIKVGGKDCGCGGREEWLSKRFPKKDARIVTIRNCDVFGECVLKDEDKILVKTRDLPACESCEMGRPFRRNLCFFMWPVKGETWKWHIQQLKQRWHLFDGKKVVAIAISNDTVSADEVKAEFNDESIHFITLVNNPRLREVAGFLPMLEHLKSTNPYDVTFCCHTKGVRHRVSLGTTGSTVLRWADVMYRGCLDHWDLVQEQLIKYPMTGCFKRTGQFKRPKNNAWHYSGTFYWFRNRDVFTREWFDIDQFFAGTESWPGRLFRVEEGGVLFKQGEFTALDLYRQAVMQQMEKEFAVWEVQQDEKEGLLSVS